MPVVDDLNHTEMEFTSLNGDVVKHTLHFWLGGDLKFLKTMMGQKVAKLCIDVWGIQWESPCEFLGISYALLMSVVWVGSNVLKVSLY